MSTLPKFDYVNAATAKEAISQLKNDWNAATIYAGGIDLLDMMKERLMAPARLVNIKPDQSLKFIRQDADGTLRIGPLLTLAEIAANEIIRRDYTALAEACGKAATPQVRNLATIGGNICQRPRCWYFRNEEFPCKRKGGATCYALEGENKYHAIFTENQPCVIVHPSAAAVALTAFDAQLKIADASGERTMPIEKFFVWPEQDVHRENVLKPGELITEITIPAAMRGMRSAYIKQREKQAYDWPLADVAIVAKMNGARIDSCRLVLGSAAPVPYRAPKAEEFLKGKEITAANATEAAKLALDGAKPLAQNGYKVPLFTVIIRRTVEALSGQKAG